MEIESKGVIISLDSAEAMALKDILGIFTAISTRNPRDFSPPKDLLDFAQRMKGRL